MLLLVLFSFIIGLFLGSFLLVVADRTERNMSFVTGRSHCDLCKHVLSWYELIPVVSYTVQGGRCRHCKTKLSLWFPASEIMAGIVVALVFVFFHQAGITPLIAYEIISLCLLAICFADIRYELIPLPLVIVATLASFVLLMTSPNDLLSHLLAAIGAGLFFLIIFLATKGRGMGFGDVIYVIFMGFILGYPQILFGLYISFIVGALISLLLIALKKRKLHGGTVPFGPFLVIGTFTMMVWGDKIIQYVTAYFR